MSKSMLGLVVLMLFWARGLVAGELEDILSRHLEARGGLEALRAVQSMRLVGELTLDDRTTAYRIEWMRPDKVRLEYDLGGATSVEAYDGETAWAISPFSNDPSPLPLSGRRERRAIERADYLEGPLIAPRQKGHQVEWLGTEELDGAEVHRLKITLANGDTVHAFLDAKTGFVVRQERTLTIGTLTLPQVASYSNYKRVGDIWMAHRIDVTIGDGEGDRHAVHGAKQRVEVERIEFNVDLDPERFRLH